MDIEGLFTSVDLSEITGELDKTGILGNAGNLEDTGASSDTGKSELINAGVMECSLNETSVSFDPFPSSLDGEFLRFCEILSKLFDLISLLFEVSSRLEAGFSRLCGISCILLEVRVRGLGL